MVPPKSWLFLTEGTGKREADFQQQAKMRGSGWIVAKVPWNWKEAKVGGVFDFRLRFHNLCRGSSLLFLNIFGNLRVGERGRCRGRWTACHSGYSGHRKAWGKAALSTSQRLGRNGWVCQLLDFWIFLIVFPGTRKNISSPSFTPYFISIFRAWSLNLLFLEEEPDQFDSHHSAKSVFGRVFFFPRVGLEKPQSSHEKLPWPYSHVLLTFRHFPSFHMAESRTSTRRHLQTYFFHELPLDGVMNT